mmetsp:Transcript_29242/g.47299  ORF Transcript_29242/g.47299 Transcript_29242/m.47299 type:complete len:206 (+) Transcript_29242:156-773(+)
MLTLHRQLTSILLLADLLQDGADHLIGDVRDVRPTTGGVDGIHKAHLLEAGAVGEAQGHFPAIVHHLTGAKGLRLHEKVHIVLEAGHFQRFAIQDHLAAPLRGGGHIKGTPPHQGYDVLFQCLHPKAGQVWKEGDLCVVLATVGADAGLMADRHVLLPDLFVLLATLGVRSFQKEFGGENVGKLRAITIASSDDLLLIVIVVVAG